MDTEKAKLQKFTEALLLEASQSADQILQKVEADRTSLLAKAEQELRAEVAAYIKKRTGEIRTREGSRVSAHLLENKRQLFAFRAECAAEISGHVAERLAAFEKTPAYGRHLEALLANALAKLPGDVPVTILLRPEDARHQNPLRQAANRNGICFQEGDFTMGGLVVLCPAKNLRIDLSFDTAYSDIANHFAELSGIDLED